MRGLTTRHGYDAGKKIKGKKRHILVDTQGLLMHAIVHARRCSGPRRRRAPDGDVVRPLSLPSEALRRWRISRAACSGRAQGNHGSSVNVEIVKRSDQAQAFVVLPRRWVVERTFAWLGRCRRLAKDWECLNSKALAFLRSPPSAS